MPKPPKPTRVDFLKQLPRVKSIQGRVDLQDGTYLVFGTITDGSDRFLVTFHESEKKFHTQVYSRPELMQLILIQPEHGYCCDKSPTGFCEFDPNYEFNDRTCMHCGDADERQ